MKKYELTDESIELANQGTKLYRIKSLIDIPSIGIKAGTLGGFLESEKNLDQEGHSWIYGNAMVYSNAQVFGAALVSGNARVTGRAYIAGNAWVTGDALVEDNARVTGNALVAGKAWITGDALVAGNALVSGNAYIRDKKSIVWFSGVGSHNGTLTVCKAKDGTLLVTRGCFYGSVDDFLKKSAEYHDEKIKREYQLLIEVARSRLS